MFTLAAFMLGLAMIIGALDLQAMLGPAEHALARPSLAVAPAGGAGTRTIVASARCNLATRGHGRITPVTLDRDLSLIAGRNQQHRAPTSADPRNELLALAAFQRRWGLPLSLYPTPERGGPKIDRFPDDWRRGWKLTPTPGLGERFPTQRGLECHRVRGAL